MLEFTCGHQECGSQLVSSSKEGLLSQAVEHLKKDHNVPTPTQTIIDYLVATCVKTVPDR